MIKFSPKLRRDTDLASEGLRVLRSDNVEVLKEIEGVMEVILREIPREIPPNPPFCKGRRIVALPMLVCVPLRKSLALM